MAGQLKPAKAKLGPGWLTPKQVAAELGVNVEFIYDACASKALKSAKFGHSTIRIRREWLDAWGESKAS